MVEWNVLTHCQSSVITITWADRRVMETLGKRKIESKFPSSFFISMKIFLHKFCLVLLICLVFKKGTCRNTETKTAG